MYKTKRGDTFSDISRRLYGSIKNVNLLRAANPGKVEPFAQGVDINTPGGSVVNNTNVDNSAMTIEIEGKVFKNFTSAMVNTPLDSIASLEIIAPFDSSNLDQREKFKPYSYKSISLKLGGNFFFNGVLGRVTPTISPEGTTVNLGCYASCGVLSHCSLPPREFIKSKLEFIVFELLKPFGLVANFAEATGDVFNKIDYDGSPIFSFLVDLAKQKGLLISSDDLGGLFFFVPAISGVSVADFDARFPPVISVTPNFSEDDYFSEITARVPTSKTTRGATITKAGGLDFYKSLFKDVKLEDFKDISKTINNISSKIEDNLTASIVSPPQRRISNVSASQQTNLSVYRPTYMELDNTTAKDLPKAIDAAIGRMEANKTSYDLELSTWFNKSGAILVKGDFVTLIAPDAMLYERELMQIKNINYLLDGETMSASLQLIKAGSYV